MTEEYRVLSHSKAKTFRGCEKLFEFKYIMGLKPKKKAIQLEKGSWVHDLLMHYYDGQDWRARHKVLTKKFMKLSPFERQDFGDLPGECYRLVTNYIYHYRNDDKLYRTIDTELDEVLTLPNGLKFRLIIDKIVEDRSGGIWVVDYKTGKEQLDPDFLVLDPQLARYHWGANEMGYKPLRGVIYDEIRTKAPTLPKFLEASGRLEQRKNLGCDPYTYFREVKRLDLDVTAHAKFIKHLQSQSERWFKRTPLTKDAPLTKRVMQELTMTAREMREAERRGQFPRTTSRNCRWCEFSNPCIIQLTGGDIRPIVKLNYEPRHSEDELLERRK